MQELHFFIFGKRRTIIASPYFRSRYVNINDGYVSCLTGKSYTFVSNCEMSLLYSEWITDWMRYRCKGKYEETLMSELKMGDVMKKLLYLEEHISCKDYSPDILVIWSFSWKVKLLFVVMSKETESSGRMSLYWSRSLLIFSVRYYLIPTLLYLRLTVSPVLAINWNFNRWLPLVVRSSMIISRLLYIRLYVYSWRLS